MYIMSKGNSTRKSVVNEDRECRPGYTRHDKLNNDGKKPEVFKHMSKKAL